MLVIEETVVEVEEQWRIANHQADDAIEIESLIAETVSAVENLKRAISDFAKFELRPGVSTESVNRAHQFGALLERSIRLLSRVKKLSDDVQRNGLNVKDANDLLILEHELKKIAGEFASRWRLPDKQTIETAKRQIAEGKFRVL